MSPHKRMQSREKSAAPYPLASESPTAGKSTNTTSPSEFCAKSVMPTVPSVPFSVMYSCCLVYLVEKSATAAGRCVVIAERHEAAAAPRVSAVLEKAEATRIANMSVYSYEELGSEGVGSCKSMPLLEVFLIPTRLQHEVFIWKRK